MSSSKVAHQKRAKKIDILIRILDLRILIGTYKESLKLIAANIQSALIFDDFL